MSGNPSWKNPRLPAWTRLLIVSAGLLTASLFAQTASSVTGNVTTPDGQPIAGVTVSGGVWKTCCPQQRDRATTDQNGQFRIDHPEGILHFVKDKLQPKTVVLGSEKPPVHVTLEPSSDALVVPDCRKLARGHRRIGWLKYGLHFDVATGTVEVSGGKPDVDYAHYVIKPRKSESYVELWFGSYAVDLVPHDEQFIKSEKFAQRMVVASAGGWLGMDSWGQQHGGGSWRHVALAKEGGAIYENVPPEQVTFLDKIVNSLCEVPHPRH